MAKLPSEADLPRREYRASSPSVTVRAPDYSPIARGMASIGEGISALSKAQEEVDDYETRKRLLDFKLQTEMELEESQREMPAGGAGYTASWQDKYRKRAQEFVGKQDSNIPEGQRGRVGVLLKQHEVTLAERAQRYEMAERDREHVTGLQEQLGRLSDVVGANPSRRDEMATEGRKQIELSRIPAGEKQRLSRAYEKQLDKVQATSRINGIQTPEDLDALRHELRIDQEDVPASSKIGSVSEKYESGGRGVGFVSSGRKDPGGPSYGKHQLSSKDSMPAFLRSEEGKPYADQFAGLTPGTAAFNRKYREIAAAEPEAFEAAQYGFYNRTHFQPLLEHAKAKGFDVTDRGVQEALFSMAIQHGGARKIVDAAVSGGSAEEQIKSLYQNRARYVAGLSDLDPETKASVLNRYRGEVRDALGLVGSSAEDRAADAADPNRTYRNLSLMERRQLYAQGQTAWKAREKEAKAELARQRVLGIIAGTEEFNPMSTEGRKALDDVIQESGIGDRIFALEDPMERMRATEQGVALSQRLRFAPKPIAEGIGGLVRSADPAKRALGYSAIYNINRQAPNALDHLPGHEQFGKDAEKFKLYSERYGGTTEALKRMAEDNDPEKQKLRKVVKEEADKWVKDKLSEDTVRASMSRGTLADWWNRPATSQDYARRNLMISEFKDVARREYEATGDGELAVRLATQHFQKRHGVSEFMGRKEIMAYPPENFWPSVGGSYAYMKKDLDTVVGTYGASADPSSVNLSFAGWGRDGKPTYWVAWKRKDDGRHEMAPRPWVPGYAEGEKADTEDWQRRRAEAMKDVWDKPVGAQPSEEGETKPDNRRLRDRVLGVLDPGAPPPAGSEGETLGQMGKRAAKAVVGKVRGAFDGDLSADETAQRIIKPRVDSARRGHFGQLQDE